ncbi:MAG: sugar ABC transporter permease [Oscillospiraceae bacterium]|nr:sugar ABC transporter permease [Oscillospiraceae bacterium]
MSAKAKKQRIGLIADIRNNKISYLLMTPYLLLFIIFIIIPVVISVIMSFTYYNIIQPPRFIGWENYRKLFFDDDVFMISVKNTLVFSVITGPLSYVACFLFAWLLNDLNPKVRSVMTLLLYVPSLSSNVLYIWKYIFSGDSYGLINGWLLKLGLIDTPLLFLKDPTMMLGVIIFVQLWMSLGTSFLTFIAGLQSIDRSHYESGAIDGIRNRWQELWYITLPEMKPQLMFGAILQITSTFAVSDISANLAGNPSPLYAAHTVSLHMMDYGTTRYEMGYALAIAVVLFLFTLVVTKIIMRLLQEKD